LLKTQTIDTRSRESLPKSARVSGRSLVPAAAVLLIFFLTLYPSTESASVECNASGDIPFVLFNPDHQEDLCIGCSGPWMRESPFIKIPVNDCKFYAAAINIFSPFGKWSCETFVTDSDGACDSGNPAKSVNFCLEDFPGGPFVNLTVHPDGSITVNASSPPCSTAVSSFLGDNFKQEKSKRDVDEFNINGKEGNEVTLTLESDPQAGNNGGQAILMLTGNSLNDAVSGALPLEITTTLPATGDYSIVVAQPKGPNALRYRGPYWLRIESASGNIDLINPTASVEK
jgi:hypothetical protein